MSETAKAEAPTLRDLREWDAAMLDHQYRAGVLTSGLVVPDLPAKPVNQCPLCDCLKLGDAVETNRRDEWCADYACRCHDEDEQPVRLFMSNGGRVSCERHVGNYATQELAANPAARHFVTPLDVWDLVVDADNDEWREAFDGQNMRCEDCGAEFATVTR